VYRDGNGDFSARSVTLTGDLTVQGTTFTVNSTVTNISDPIFTIGGGAAGAAPSTDDNKDRGIAFQWHDGSAAKVGFFGYDDSTGHLTFVPDATISNEVVSGTVGSIQASLIGNVTGVATTATNVAGGTANQIVYQSGVGQSSFITAPSAASTYLSWDGSGYAWASTVGPQGPQGPQGATGPQGPQGPSGVSGARTFSVTNSGASDYVIDGSNDPTINLLLGFTYTFSVNASGHPFWIQTSSGAYNASNVYNTGVTNNGTDNGTITFAVPYNAPSTLYYVCQHHSNMAGTINISAVGPQGPQGATGPTGPATSINATDDTSTASAFYPIFSAGTGAQTPKISTTKFTFQPSNGAFRIESLGVGTAASGTAGEIRATNEITAYYSDRRLKENVVVISDAINKVQQLHGITYTPNDLATTFGYDKNVKLAGLFADEVESVLPEAVKAAPFDINEFGNSKSGENYKTVQYEKIVPLLIEAIKEQQRQIAQLSDALNKLVNK